MFFLVVVALIGVVILVVSTDQFVAGAIRIANGLGVSSVIVGAVVLGCGTALPELALAFHREAIHWRDVLHANSGGVGGLVTLVFVLSMAVLLSPTIHYVCRESVFAAQRAWQCSAIW